MLRPSTLDGVDTPAASANVGAMSRFSTMSGFVVPARAPTTWSSRTTIGTRIDSSYGTILPMRRCSPSRYPLSDMNTISEVLSRLVACSAFRMPPDPLVDRQQRAAALDVAPVDLADLPLAAAAGASPGTPARDLCGLEPASKLGGVVHVRSAHAFRYFFVTRIGLVRRVRREVQEQRLIGRGLVDELARRACRGRRWSSSGGPSPCVSGFPPAAELPTDSV